MQRQPSNTHFHLMIPLYLAYSENMDNETTVSGWYERLQFTDHFQVYFAESHVSDAEKNWFDSSCRWGPARAMLELHSQPVELLWSVNMGTQIKSILVMHRRCTPLLSVDLLYITVCDTVYYVQVIIFSDGSVLISYLFLQTGAHYYYYCHN